MKKFLNFIIILIIGFIATSCVDTTNNALTIKVEDNVLVWNSYQGAVSYNIYIDNILTDNVTDIKYDLNLKEGTYKIKINAALQVGYSSFSNTFF